MRLTEIAGGAVSELIARWLRRAIALVLIGIFAAVAIGYASAAAFVALTLSYGPIQAHLIMAGLYAVAALIALAVYTTLRPRSILSRPDAPAEAAGLLSSPRNMQIAMLIEAVMLGYSLARKSGKSVL